MSNWWLSRQSNNDRARAKAGRRTSGRAGSRSASRKSSAIRRSIDGRAMALEQMEDRLLLTSGPQLISIIPNDGSLLLPNETVSNNPTQLTFRFLLAAGETIAPNSLTGIQLARSGGDGAFGNANDVSITPGYVGIDPAHPNQVQMRFSSPLPDDLYQITIVGAGNGALTDQAKVPFNGGVNYVQDFRLQLGPQVLSVVPQPVSRDPAGVLTPHNNEIDVYFNEPVQTLPGDATHLNAGQFELLYTNNTANASDDQRYTPSSVSYDAFNNEAKLIFANNLDSLGGVSGDTAGALRLRIGNTDTPVSTPLTIPGTTAATSGTFLNATELPGSPVGGLANPLPATQQTVIFNGNIQQQSDLNGLVFPGGLADPGHRNIPLGENHVGGIYAGVEGATISYGFPSNYGSDPNTGQPLFNQITANQEQTVREVFQLYSYYTGLNFIEQPGGGDINIAVGDVRTVQKDIPPTIGGISGGSRIVINGNINWGASLYGSGFMSVAMHEIGHSLGLPHDDDGPPDTVMNGGAETVQAGGGAQGLFPGIADITNLQFTHEPTSNQIDLYKFTVDSSGTLNAQTTAQRLASVSQLNTLITLYEEFNDLNLPASGAQVTSGDTFTITATNTDGTAGTPVTFEFTQVSGDPTQVPAGTVLPGGHIEVPFNAASTQQDLAVTIVSEIQSQKMNVSATIGTGSVQLAGPLTVTASGTSLSISQARTMVSRNDDYYGTDSFASLAVQPGIYYAAVTSSGNDQFDPNVAYSGWGGNTLGPYQLSLNFQPTSLKPLTDPGLSLLVPASPVTGAGSIPNGYRFTLTDINQGTGQPVTETVTFYNGATAPANSAGHINVQVAPTDTQDSLANKLVTALNSAIADGNFNPLNFTLTNIGNGRVEVGGAASTSIVVDPSGNLAASAAAPLVLWGTTARDSLVGNSGPGGTGAFNFWFNAGPTVYVDKAAASGGNGTAAAPYNTIQAALSNPAVTGAPATGQEVNVRVEPNAHATLAIASSQNGIAVGQTFQVAAGPYKFTFEFVASGTNGAQLADSNFAVVIGSAPNPASANVSLAIYSALNSATLTLPTGRQIQLAAADGGGVTVTQGIDGAASSYSDGNYYYVYLFQGAQPITVAAQTTPFSKLIAGVTPPAINNNNAAYLVGTDQFGNLLPDDSPANSILQMPKNTVLMIDAGSVFKLRQANIEVGSSAVNIDQSQSALQVLGIPGAQTVFTSYNDDTATLGAPLIHPGASKAPGDWGGLVFNNDSDLETLGSFLNSVNEATITYGGGRVVVNGVPSNYDSIYLSTARPAITNDVIINGAGAAISGNPDSFESTLFGSDLTITVNRLPTNGDQFTLGTVKFQFTTNGVVAPGFTGISIAGMTTTTQVAGALKAAINQFVLTTTNSSGASTLIDQAQSLGSLVTLPDNITVNGVSLTSATTIGGLTFTPDSFSTDYQRFGPDVHGNLLTTGPGKAVAVSNPNNVNQQIGLTYPGLAQDTINGILVRINTNAGQSLDTLDVSAVFAATDIPYVLQENLVISGNTGGNLRVNGVPVARIAGQLLVEPGVLIKLGGSRIETQSGANVIAEGTAAQPIVFTSINDARYGGGGTFDTANSGATVAPKAGDWAGLYFWPTARGSFDQTLITFGGGSSAIEGGFANFDAIEIHQAKVRIADSVLENNASGADGSNRNGRMFNDAATIFVLGAQPSIVNNVIQNNQGAAISTDVDSLDSNQVPDWGRSTGPLARFTQFDSNDGPLVRLNQIGGNGINGMVVRGGMLETSSVWDDTDVVHVVEGTVTVPNFASVGGLRIESSATQSLVIKMERGAGFDASGSPGDISDRIGGEIQILGTPNHPVIITSVNDDTVGAGLTPNSQADNDTNGDGAATQPTPGDWNSVLLDQYSNDRNVAMIEQTTAGPTPATAQSIGQLAPNQQSGDDNLRLGFQVNGYLNTPQAINTYTFKGTAGTQAFLSVTNTSPALDAVLELVDANGNVLARSDQADAEQQDANVNGDPMQAGPLLTSDLPGSIAQPLQDSTIGVPGLGLENFWSTNLKDPGFRVTLPGPAGVNNYYVRVYAKGAGDPPPATNTSGGLPAPTANSATPSTTGGGMLSATYYYEVTATTATGETTASGQQSATVSGPTGSVNLSWNPVAGATGYKIYRSTEPFGSLANQYYDLVAVVTGGSVGSYLDTGTNLTYLPDTATPGAASHGLVGGQYELQVRLQQMVEVPGSTVQNADIRFATNGIDVEGLPAHSPLIANTSVASGVSTTTPATGNQGTGVPAQNIGDLITSDTSSLNAAGNLAGLDSVQWYTFNLTYAQIQVIGGGQKTWSTVFDVGYADGLTRPDTEVDVYDSAGNLIYVGRDSNVADQQPPPTPGTSLGGDAGLLSHSSFGQNDPYIGPVQMLTGNPGAPQTYYVAVHSSSVLPSAIDATFNAAATDYLVRLEPVDSMARVVEDHIGTAGGGTAQDPATLTPLFGNTTGTPAKTNPAGDFTVANDGSKITTAGYQQLNSYATPYNLSDVVLYVSATGTDGQTHLFTYNPFTGIAQTDQGAIGNQSASGFGMNAIAMRNDGQLYGMETGTGDKNTNLVQINTGTPGQSTIAGNAAITTYYFPPPSFNWTGADAGIQFDAMTFVQSQGSNKITEPNGANDRLLFAVGHRDPRDGSPFNGDNVTPQGNMLYELNPNTGNSSGFVVPNALGLHENPLPADPTRFTDEPIVFVTDATNGAAPASDIVDSTWWGPSVRSNQAYQRADGTYINTPPNQSTADLSQPMQGVLLRSASGNAPSPGIHYYEVTATTNGGGETNELNPPQSPVVNNEQSIAIPPSQLAPTTDTTAGALNSATYYYVVTAVYGANNQETSASNEQNIKVIGPGEANISWNPFPGATSYNIYRGTVPGGENVLVGSVGPTTTSFADIGGATTPGTPSFTAQGGVIVSWAPVPGATGYNVYSGDTASGSELLLQANAGTINPKTGNYQFLDGTGVTPTATKAPPSSNNAAISSPVQNPATASDVGGSLGGATTTTYFYEVTATTALGESLPSNVQSIVVTGPHGEATVNWQPVSGANGYKVYRGLSPLAMSYMVGDVPAGTTSFVDTFNGPTRVTVAPTNLPATTFEMDSGPEVDFFTSSSTPGGTGSTVANGGGTVMTTAAAFRNGETFQLLDPVTGNLKTFYFQNSGAVLPFLQADGVSQGDSNTIREHETFTLTGSKGTATFEFVHTGDPVTPGNIAVLVSLGQSLDGVMGDIVTAINGSGINVTAAQPQPGDNRLQLVGLQAFVNNAPNEFPYGLAPIAVAPFGDIAIPFLESDSLFTLENEIAAAVNGTFGGDIIANVSNDLSFIDGAGKQQFYGSRMAFLSPSDGRSILPSPTALTAGMIDPADDPGSSRQPTGFTYMQGSDNGVAFAGDARVPFHLNDVADNFELPAPPPGANAIDVELRNAINKVFPGTAFNVPNSTFTAFGVELQGTRSTSDSATLPFDLKGAEGNGGNITGLAAIGTNLYAVTDGGSLYQILYSNPSPGVYNPNGATLQWIANIDDPTTNQPIAFHGLTVGPPDVDNGAYANTLFATSESGVLYAFDSKGNLLPVFHNASAVATERQSSIQLPGVGANSTQGSAVGSSLFLYNNVSLAFSTLDYNLWHVTNTNADANQGINVSADQSRNPLSPNKPPPAGDSMYFGLEAHSDNANTPQNALPVDSSYYGTATYNGGTTPYNTYNVPGGAYGSMTTNTFSLSGYNAGQKPTLYFDYYLDAGGNYSIKNTAPAPFSSARVFVSPDGGNTWQLVATNDTVLAAPPAPAIDATTQMPSYISTSENTGSGDARQQVQPLWDSVANNSTWRQARIDLSKYAGDTNLELRFDFSTSGTTYNPSSPGNYAQGKDNTGAGIDSLAFDNSFGANYDNGMQPSARAGIGQNLNHAGWYVDNIIVGFAGKGEMVTNASKLAGAANTGYFAVPPNPDPNRVRPIPSGPYELEIRRGAEYGSTISDQKPDIGLGGTFSVNDRLDSSYSLNTDFSQTPQPVVAAGSASWNFSNLAPTTDGQGILSLSLTAQMTADAKLPTNLNVPSAFKVTIPQLSGGNAFSQTITLNTPATGQPQGQSVSARYTLSAAQMAILTGLPSFDLVVTQVSNVDTDQIGIVSAEATLDYMPFAEHQQFMIDDGKNRQTFEFVRSGDSPLPGNKAITYSVGSTTPQDMASAIITAINGVYNPTTFNVSARLSGGSDNRSTGVIYLFGAQNVVNGGPGVNLYGVTYGSTSLLDSAYFGPGSLSNQDTFVVRYDPAFLSDQFTSNFGDTTMPRPQGAVILSGNQVSNSQNSGILVESSPRGQLVGPTVIFSGGGGSGATGTAVVSGGQVVGITITSGGSGYTSPPTVSVSGGGTGAILGTAVISNGAVTSVPVLAGGASYANGDNIQGLPHQGAVVNTPTLNSDLLVPGVTIINNLIYGVSATGSGITFAGDPDLGNTVAAVPFGRIVNNTIYGGYTSTDANGVTTPVGIGINVAKNASPTMLNNILANLQTGIQLDNSSKNQVSPPVLGENIYQNNTSNFNVSPGTFAIQLQPKDPLFINPTTDPGTANFYLQESSQAIDSSINSLQDRAEMTAVTGPLAIAPSPIIAPSVDLYGQLRVPDPNVSPFPGLGNNVFIDRGAIERVDNPSVGLTAALLSPIDNGATDRNPAANVVFIRGQSLSEFTIQFSDGTGPGVYDASVLAKRLEIVEDGRLLTAGTDYFFDYDNNNHIIHLVAASGVWLNGHQYDIYLSNGNNGGSFDPFNASSKPGPITDRAGNNLQANEPSGLTHFRLLLAYDENSPPVLNMPTGAQVDQAYDAALNPASPIPAAGSIYEGTSVTFSQALGDPITIYDVDANGGKETVTLTANTGILTLSPDGIASLQSISGAMYEYLDGSGNQVAGPTGTLVITAPLGDLKSVPVAPGLVTALDGLTFTPGPYFNSDVAGQNATLAITVNDNGSTPPPARQTTTAVSLHVIAVNNPPSNDLPAAVAGTTAAAPLNVGEDVPVVFASTAPSGSVAVGQVSVSDPDVPPGSPFYNNTNQAPYEEIISLAPANAGKLSLGTVPAGINFLNGSSNNSATLDFAGTLSAINQAIANLVFTETRDFPGALAITFTTNDGGNLGLGPAPTYAAPPQPLSDTKTIYINVVPDNDAPVLDTADAVSFPTISEDAGSGFPGEPADAGSSVLSMLQSAAPTVANIITLKAPGAQYGIAITSATPAVGGTWQYSLGAGGNWVNFPAVSASKALLLDGADWVRFLPDPEFSGTGASSPSITFQAWDETYDAFSQTNDVHGTTISLNSDPSKGAGTGGSWPFSVGSTTATLAVTPDNDAPVLVTSAVHFAAIPEDAGSGFPGEPANLGSTVLSMLQSAAGGGNVITLAAAGAKYGIAVTGADTTNGTWQYQLSGSGTWTTIAAGAGKAVLLDGADLVRFLPKPEFSGSGASAPSLSFVAWDETYDAFTKVADAHGTTVTLNSDPTKGAGSGGSWPFSTASSTATIDVTADNDAPLLDNSHPLSFASIPEDAGGPIPGDPADIGSSVLSMLQSAAPAVANVMTLQAGGAKYGIGVTSVNTMNGGVWQYSLNGGAKWLSFPSAITAPTGLAALVLDGADLVRFLPNDEFTGTGAGAPSLSFLAWDQTYNLATSGSDAPGTLITNVLQGNSAPFSLTSATATLEVTPVVDAPQLTSSGAVFFAPINEDVADTNNGGSSVVAMLASTGGNIDQLNAPGAKYGIAVTQVTQYANGNWQFSTDGGKTWTTFDPSLNAPATPGSSALLLDGADLVRFRPTTPNFNSTAANPVWGATPSLSFVAWDETDDPIASRTDTNGKYVDLTMSGGTGGSTPFSLLSNPATASLTVKAVDDAPVVTTSTTTFQTAETLDASDGSQTITIKGVSVSDVDAREAAGGAPTETLTVSVPAAAGTISLGGRTASSVTVTDTLFNLNNDLAGLTFRPALESALVSPVSLAISISDLGNFGSLPNGVSALTASGAVTITITPTHHAPILLADPAAQTILENVPSATNRGASLDSLLTTSVASFDSDAGAVSGIAVTGTSVTPTLAGKWQYSTDGGGSWTDISANVSPTNALLLPGTDLLRFNPATGTAGVANLAFHAWDQTSGQAGGTANLTAAGATGEGTAFSVAEMSATWNVQLVNQPPTFTLAPSANTLENNTIVASGGSQGGSNAGLIVVPGFASNISPGQPVEAQPPYSQLVTFQVTNNNNALFSLQPYIVGTDPNDPAKLAHPQLQPGDLIYMLQPDVFGTATLTVSAKDNDTTDPGNNQSGVYSPAPTINVGLINDPPTIASVGGQTVLEDSAASTISLSGITAGLNEAGQSVTITATSDNPALLPNPTIAYDGTAPAAATGTLTFQPAKFHSGTAHVTITVKDNAGTANGGVDSFTETFTVTVTPVNHAPSFKKGNDQTINEDTGAHTVTGWATNISPGPDPVEASQQLNFIVTTNNDSLFTVAPAIDPATGTLTYTLAPDISGAATVSVVLHDNGGTDNGGVDTSAPQKFQVNVQFVNDAPSFTIGTAPPVLENSGKQSVNFATNISPDEHPTPAANEASQTVHFVVVGDDNPALFAVGPAISPTGVLTYQPAPDSSGTANITVELQDNAGTANGGVDTSTTVTFPIVVRLVDDPPTFTFQHGSQVVNEDSGSHVVTNWATQISPGVGANEASQHVNFIVTNDNPALFAPGGQPTLVINGTNANLQYTLASTPPVEFGAANVTVTLKDDGDTTYGGSNTSLPANFQIYVNQVNHPPFLANPVTPPVVNENTGPFTIPSSVLSKVFDDYDLPFGDHLTLSLVSNDNPGLVDAVLSGGDAATAALTFDFVHDQFGVANIDLRATDQAGKTVDDTFSVTVNHVNQPPSFTIGPDVRVNENAGAQSIAGWATGISAGPGNESGQSLNFFVTGNSNPSLFSVAPAVDGSTGTLSFTPAPGAFGTATLSLLLQDNGGTANGGQDTTSVQTFNIRVIAPPSAQPDSYVLSVGTTSSATAADGVLANDSDPNGDPLTATIVSQPTNGTVTFRADGSFTYTKGPSFAGIDSFTYQVHNESNASGPITVSIISYEATIVKKLYEQVLNRDPDTAGLEYWTTKIQQGQPYSVIAQGIFESNERLDPIITQYYQQFLFRQPDELGLSYWRDQVWKKFGGPEHVIEGMISSPEFFKSAGGTNTGWVTALYERLLKREPDQQGLGYWVNALDNQTMTEANVVTGFLSSKEYYSNLVTGFFEEYLLRQPSSSELSTYVAQMLAGSTQRDIQDELINTDEYRNSPPPPNPGTVRILPA